MPDESDSSRTFLYFLNRGVVPIHEDNSNITRIYGRLFLDDDDITIPKRRLHRGSFDLEREIVTSGCHFRRNFLIIKNFLNSINGDACYNATQNRNFYTFLILLGITE